MNLFASAVLLIISPSAIQLIFGSLAIKRKIAVSFEFITFLCCVAQVVFFLVAIKIIAIDTRNQNVKCGLPQAAMAFAGILFFVILLAIILVQLFVRRKIKINHPSLSQSKK